MYESKIERWVLFRAYVIDVKLEEMGLNQEPQLLRVWINLNEVSSFGETKIEIGGEDETRTEVCMKSGMSYVVPESLDEFSKIMFKDA